MRHKHADLIKEWVEDPSRVLQFRGKGNQKWYDADITTLLTMSDYEWRFKPESKPDVVRYVTVYKNNGSPILGIDDNLELTFDGETGKLKSAEVINE